MALIHTYVSMLLCAVEAMKGSGSDSSGMALVQMASKLWVDGTEECPRPPSTCDKSAGHYFNTCGLGKLCHTSGCVNCPEGNHICDVSKPHYSSTCPNNKRCTAAGCENGYDPNLGSLEQCCGPPVFPPTPSPTASPTAAPITSMSGDPHIFFNGTRTTIHLPTDRVTKLLEQGGVSIYTKGGPNNDTKMNYIDVVMVSVDGEEVARIEQEQGQLSEPHALMKLTAGGSTTEAEQAVGRVHPSMRMESKRDRIRFVHVPTGLDFVVASRRTTRKDATNSHHLNLRFDGGLVTSGTGSAEGALPQIWGTQPLSEAVAALVRHRSKLNDRLDEDNDSVIA